MGELHDEIVRAFWDGVGEVRPVTPYRTIHSNPELALDDYRMECDRLEAELEVALATIDVLRQEVKDARGT